jgi:hypothetical protein
MNIYPDISLKHALPGLDGDCVDIQFQLA